LTAAHAPPYGGIDTPSAVPAGVARLQIAFLWLVGFSSAFVKFEPAPYDLIVILAMALFAATGLKLRAAHVPLLILMVMTTLAYGISVVPVSDREGTLVWSAVSSFLAITSLFFAAALTEDTARRLHALLAGYVASAVLASIVAIVTWARLVPGSEFFILNGRSLGTFKDANVFGPFLILPVMIVIDRLLAGRYRSLLINVGIVLLIGAALLLTFSRGAWGHFAASFVVMFALTFLTVQTHRERVRLLVIGAAGLVVVATFLILLLSIGAVGELFKERASLVQYYDIAPGGRLDRYLPGFMMMLDNPFGIGPLQFTRFFPEDPHNSFLNAFASGGWLGGIAHTGLVLITLAYGFGHAFRRSPYQRIHIAVYATFVAEVGESLVVDVQHWRHFYLLIGLIWGLMALRSVGVARTEVPAYSAPPHRSVAQPG
jgi:hypothetical protein